MDWTMPALGVNIGSKGALSATLYNPVKLSSGQPLITSDSLLNTAIDRLTLTPAGAGGASQPPAPTDSPSEKPVSAASSYQSAQLQLQAMEVSALLGTPASGDGSSSFLQGSSAAAVNYQAAEAQLQAAEVSTLLGNANSATGYSSSNGMSDLLAASARGTAKAAYYGSIIQAKTSASAINQYA